jgi:hypothetical protein
MFYKKKKKKKKRERERETEKRKTKSIDPTDHLREKKGCFIVLTN